MLLSHPMSRRHVTVCLGFLLCCLWVCPASAATSLTLVQDGQAQATIVIDANPTEAAAFAALEFRDHVRQITGADLPVVTNPAPVTGPLVLIGESDATRQHGLHGADFQSLEHLVAFRDEALVLLGHDKDSFYTLPSPIDLTNAPRPGWFDERGTLNAVYDALEFLCGVRWYHPMEVGTVCVTNPTLTVEGIDLQRTSSMRNIQHYFHAGYTWTDSAGETYRIPDGQVDLWRLRMRLGGHPILVDHSLYDYYDRFLDTHPEWFAQGYDDVPQPPQLCYSQAGLIEQVAQDARDYFDGTRVFTEWPTTLLPFGGDFYPVVPMDDTRWCQCAACQAQLDPERTGVFTSGEASNYIWEFINQVALEIQPTHPGKSIASLAYHQYAFYPDRVALTSNVAAQFCLWNVRGWHIPALQECEWPVLQEWTAQQPDLMKFVRLYYMNPVMTATGFDFQPFPVYFGHTGVEQMEAFHSVGVSALWMHHVGELSLDLLYDWPEQYLTFRMAENSLLDGEALFDEFFTLYYGAASEPMRLLYQRLESTYTNAANYPAEWLAAPNVRLTESISWETLGTPALMLELGVWMEQAELLAVTSVEQERVAHFKRSVWDAMLQGAEDHRMIEERRNAAFEVGIPRTPGGQSCEGNPSNVNWSAAVDIGELSSIVGIPNPIERGIHVKLIHDETWLYIQSLEDVDPDTLDNAFPFGLESYTDPRFSDSFVFMVSPPGQNLYRQIAIFGVGDGRVDVTGSGEADQSWHPSWDGVSDKSLAPDQWRVWITVPLADLLAGGAGLGTEFNANIYRYCQTGQRGLLVWRPHFVEDQVRSISYMGTMRLQGSVAADVVMDATLHNGALTSDAVSDWWNNADAVPYEWSCTPPVTHCYTAALMILLYGGSSVAFNNTGEMVQAQHTYTITADLGGVSGVDAHAYVYATENPDGTGEKVLLAHASRPGNDSDGYNLFTVSDTGTETPPGLAGYYVQVALATTGSGNAYYDNIRVTLTPVPGASVLLLASAGSFVLMEKGAV